MLHPQNGDSFVTIDSVTSLHPMYSYSPGPARNRTRLTVTSVPKHAIIVKKVKGKVFPYSLPSVGPGADPGVQAVSPQVT